MTWADFIMSKQEDGYIAIEYVEEMVCKFFGDTDCEGCVHSRTSFVDGMVHCEINDRLKNKTGYCDESKRREGA